MLEEAVLIGGIVEHVEVLEEDLDRDWVVFCHVVAVVAFEVELLSEWLAAVDDDSVDSKCSLFADDGAVGIFDCPVELLGQCCHWERVVVVGRGYNRDGRC